LATGPYHNDYLLTLRTVSAEMKLIFDVTMH